MSARRAHAPRILCSSLALCSHGVGTVCSHVGMWRYFRWKWSQTRPFFKAMAAVTLWVKTVPQMSSLEAFKPKVSGWKEARPAWLARPCWPLLPPDLPAASLGADAC